MRSKNRKATLPLRVLDEASVDRAIQMLHGENDLYWHGRIKRILRAAGIATRRIERMEEHPIWPTRQAFDWSLDNKAAIRQLRRVLRDGGIKILRDQFNIIDRRGNKIRCIFMLDLGAPGDDRQELR